MNRKQLLHQLKLIFLNGFFAIFPLSATVLALNFLYKLSVQWLAPLRHFQSDFINKIPGSEIILMIIIILFTGVLVQFFIISPILHYLEKVISHIPFVNSIYSAAKSVSHFFNINPHEKDARKVVLVNFPRKEYFNLAFLLGRAHKYTDAFDSEEEHVRLFLPTSPTPGTGYFVIVPRSEVIETELTFEEALKIVISCGVITPQKAQDIVAKEPS